MSPGCQFWVLAFSTKMAASCQSTPVRSTALTPLFFMLMTSVVKSDCQWVDVVDVGDLVAHALQPRELLGIWVLAEATSETMAPTVVSLG